MADFDWANAAKPPAPAFDWSKAAEAPHVTVHGEANPAPEWATEQDLPDQGQSQGHAAVNGLAGGASLNWADEAAGKAYEFGNYLRNLVNGLGVGEAEGRRSEDKRFGRDSARADMRASEKAWPKTTLATNVAGDAATQAIMAAGTGGASLTPAGLAITSGIGGLGASEADLDSGKPREFLKAGIDTGSSALVGGLTGKLGEKLIPSATGFVQRKLGQATGDAAAEVAQKAGKVFNSARGTVGGDTAAVLKAVETAEKIVSDPLSTPDVIAKAKAFLSHPNTTSVILNAYDSAMEQAGRRGGALTTSRSALEEATKALAPKELTAATEKRLSGGVGRVASRWPHLVNKVLPVVTGAVGGATGHGVTGTALGLGAGLVMGHGGTVLKNMTKDPAIRKLFWSATESALRNGGEALGKYGPYLAREYARDPEHARAIDEALMSELPEYAAKKLQWIQGSSP